MIAPARSVAPRGAVVGHAAEAAHDLVAVELDADADAGGGHRHLRGVDAPASAAAPCILIAASSPGRPVEQLALPELATTTRSASSRAWSWQTSTGAASTPERVGRAALVVAARR